MAAPRRVPVSRSSLRPGELVGQYEVLERLADGEMASVYRVRHGSGVYALKILATLLDDADDSEDQRQARARAEVELAALMAVEHPNLLRVYAFERWPELTRGWPCIVTEYVDGPDIGRWRDEASPSLRRIVVVLAKVADALEHLHEAGVFHRDVKAPNILVRRSNDEPVLIDLGVARHAARRPVTRCEAVGTDTHYAPEYVAHIDSPAGFMGEPFNWTPQVDLYALGYVAYQLLANRAPVASPGGTQALLSAIKNDPAPAICAVNPAVPDQVGGLVMRLLEKDPASRPSSAGEMRRELEEIARGMDRSFDEPFPVPGVSARSRSASAPVRSSSEEAAGDAADPEADEVGDLADPQVEPIDLGDEDDTGAARDAPEDREPRVPTCIRKLRERYPLDEPRTGRRRTRVAVLVVAAFVTIVVASLIVARRDTPHKQEDLLARVGREEPVGGERTSAEAQPAPPATAVSPVATAAEPISRPRPPVPPLPEGDIDAAIAARYGRPKAPLRAPQTDTAMVAAPGPSQTPVDDGPLLRSVRLETKPPADPTTPRKFGVPMGAHLRARLVSNLDSRTIGGGPVEAILVVPVMARGQVVLPARTMVYGRASDAGGRFSIRFTTLRLPDDTEVAFEGLALDRGDNKPGLAPTARISPRRGSSDDGLAKKIARGTGNLVLGTLTGGLAEDAARNAGSELLNQRDSVGAGTGGGAFLLDAGGVFEVWVAKAF